MAGAWSLREANLTATVLFTDLVGSTATRVGLGEDAADALIAVHDELLREAIESHEGTVIKGGGDGVMALFTAASDALAAAEACQQAVWRHNQASVVQRLEVRIGLSVGDVAVRGGDCFGTPVIEAARLEEAAEGGQVLCSDLVRLMARGRGGHDLRPVGALELKGLPGPIDAYELHWQPPRASLAERGPLPPELRAETSRPFVGRSAELGLGCEVVDRPRDERLAVLWLAGEPGIGKTTLAAHIADHAHQLGARVLFGRCNEDLGAPYQPFVEALRQHVATLSHAELEAGIAASGPILLRLLPELAERLPGLEPPPPVSPETDRYELFEAVRRWLVGSAWTAPLVVVLDDVQWATAPTLSMMGHVARASGPAAVTLVCTARDTSPDDVADVRRLRDDLARRATLHTIDLRGLDAGAVAELVGDHGEAARLVAETAGNPLYIDALTRGASVASLARERVSRLDADVQELLTVASVIGLDFPLGITAAAAGIDELSALAGLEAAARAGLVKETGPDQFSFTHALVRAALRQGISRSRRIRLHAAVAAALGSLAASDPLAVQAMAHHCLEAGPAVAPAVAAVACLEAATLADVQLALRDAAGWYRESLRLQPDPAQRVATRLRLGTALFRANDFAAALHEFETAYEDGLAAGDLDVAAEAALQFEECSWRPGFVGTRAAKMIEAVIAARGGARDDPVHRAPLLAGRARALVMSGRRIEAMPLAEEALAIEIPDDEPRARAEVLTRCGYPQLAFVPDVRTTALGAELAAIGRSIGDIVLELHGVVIEMGCVTTTGDAERARELQACAEALNVRCREPFWDHVLLSYAIGVALDAADFAAAEAATERASRPVEPSDSWTEPEGLYGLRMFLIRREQGRLAEVAPALRLLTRTGDHPIWRPGLALLLVELGEHAEAATQFDAIAADGFAGISRDDNRLLQLCFTSEVCVALGRAEEARSLEDELTRTAGRVLVLTGSGVVLGPGDRYLGLLRAVQGDRDGARAHLLAAVALARRSARVRSTAWALADLAVECGDRAARREAAALAERHGLVAVARRLARRPAWSPAGR